jgi:hypothetical protein
MPVMASTASGSSMGPAWLLRFSATGASPRPCSRPLRTPMTLARARNGSSLASPESSVSEPLLSSSDSTAPGHQSTRELITAQTALWRCFLGTFPCALQDRLLPT